MNSIVLSVLLALAAPAERTIHAPEFWGFRTPRATPTPSLVAGDDSRSVIDAYVRARLEDEGLEPSREAARRVLARRLSFDLTGLPPDTERVEDFLRSSSPGAYEKLVDELLASPGFGEHLARLWLDVSRYAEDQAHIVGSNKALFYPNAYLYRNWVIGAFNDDLAYDDFVRRQLAADQLGVADPAELAALGFLGLGPKYYRRNAPEVMADEWEDRVDTVTRGFMGLTIACARCHDHKFDPITTQDYYALAGIFASTIMFNRPLDDSKPKGKSGEAKKADESLHIIRDGKAQDIEIHLRGDATQKGARVERRFPEALASAAMAKIESGSGRRELAESIASESNPLTARVIVNRVWARLFGRGLVTTPSNFGALGARPSHPELLDRLAIELQRSGWSLKWLVREIVLSATYRQSSEIDPAKHESDPENSLLWRMPRRRLQVEALRDALLVATGELEPRLGGPSIEPQSPDERARSIYSRISRFELPSMLATFDFPDPNVHAARRNETTTPLQKLFTLNSPFIVARAKALATRLLEDSPRRKAHAEGEPISRILVRERVRRAYALLYAREPEEAELELAGRLFGAENADDARAWRNYAQALMASNEMLYVD